MELQDIGIVFAIIFNVITFGFGMYKWKHTRFESRMDMLERELAECRRICAECDSHREELRRDNLALLRQLASTSNT